MLKKVIYLPIMFLALVTLPVACNSSDTAPTTITIGGKKIMQWSSPPKMSIDSKKDYTATISTNYGDIVIQLLTKEAPVTVNNFVFLSRQGFYNGVIFHRVVKGFVIQSGDPTGTGSGSPGYKFADEKVTRNYVAGTLAMANSGKNTNGSQFFITLTDVNLPKAYNIFGLVTAGFDVVTKIGDVPVALSPSGEKSQPTVDVHINSITIVEK